MTQAASATTFPFNTEALVVQQPEADFELQGTTLNEVRPNEVLVEMKHSGICPTVERLETFLFRAYDKVNSAINRTLFFSKTCYYL